MKTVWIYVDTDLLPGDVNHLQVFASEDAARRWIEEHDPEAAAFEYPVRE
jgi:hypothetical protein